jgi:hypothetical protein
MNELELYTPKDSDFDFLNDKYWLIRSCFAERGLNLPDEPPPTDEEDDFFENYPKDCNKSNGYNHQSTGSANNRSDVLERLQELEALERMERKDRDFKKAAPNINVSSTVVRTRPTLSRAMLNKLKDIDTRTFTRPRRSPVHPNRSFASHFDHNLSEDLLNISEADIEADMNRIMGKSLFSSDTFVADSPLTNNQSFIITKTNGNSGQTFNMGSDATNDVMNATFVNDNGSKVSPGFANNYDDVQEIARIQEESLKKKSNLLRNNTIVKTRRERVIPDLDTTMTLNKDDFQDCCETMSKMDLNTTFSKTELPAFMASPEAVLNLDSPGTLKGSFLAHKPWLTMYTNSIVFLFFQIRRSG